MPLYDVQMPDGKVYRLEGDHPPSEEEATEALKGYTEQNKTSAGASYLRSLATSVLPNITGAAGAALGVKYAPATRGLSLLIPAAGALLGSMGGSYLQKTGIEAVSPETEKLIERGEQEHPTASLLGGLTGGAGVFRIAPGQAIRGMAAIPSILKGTGTEAQFDAARVAATQLGIGAGFGVAQPLMQGRLPTWADVGQGALGTAIFGQPRSKILLPRAARAVQEARLKDITRQAQPQTTEVPSASSEQEAATVHGDVRTQPQQGLPQVPVQEGRPGVQPPQAQQTQVLLSPQHEQILNDVLTVETAAGKNVRVIDGPEGEQDPISGALGTIDRSGKGEIILNKQELARLAQDYPKLDMRALLERLIAHENIHLHTDDASALKYWNNLWNWERMITKRRVTGTWHGERMVQGGQKLEMNDTQWGHEALRYRLEQLSGMEPSEFAAAVGRERITLKMIDALESVVRGIRNNFTARGGLEWEIINHIQDNLEAGRMVLTGQATPQEIESNPFMLRKGRKWLEGLMKGKGEEFVPKFSEFAPPPAQMEMELGDKQKGTKLKGGYGLPELKEFPDMPPDLFRRLKALTQTTSAPESVPGAMPFKDVQTVLDNIAAGGGVMVHGEWRDASVEGVPDHVMLMAKEYMRSMEGTGEGLIDRLKNFKEESFKDFQEAGRPHPDILADYEYYDNLLKSELSRQEKSGTFMRRKGRPKKDPYEPGQAKFEVPGMPGQRPVAGKEEAERTYGELKMKAAPGVERDVLERSVEGLVPKRISADEYLNRDITSTTSVRDIPGEGSKTFTSWHRPNFEDFAAHYPTTKLPELKNLWMDAVWKSLINAPAARLQKWADALEIGFTDVSREGETRIPEPAEPVKFKLEGEDVRPAEVKKEERERLLSKERFRSRVISRIGQKLIAESQVGAQPLDRTSLEHEDLAFDDDRTAFGAYVKISPDIAKDPEAIRRIVADRSRPSSDVPITHTKRLLAMENKAGQVAVVSAYIDADGKVMLVKPGEIGERPNRPFEEVVKDWTPFSSSLLRHPVQDFMKRYDSVKHFEDSIDASYALDRSAASRFEDVYGGETADEMAEEEEEAPAVGEERPEPQAYEKSFRVFTGIEPTPLGMVETFEESGPNLGRTGVEEGEGGMFMGPHAEQARGTRGGEIQRARILGQRDLTATEADSLYNLITGRVKQPYTAENLKSLEAYLGKRWAADKLNPAERAAIIALQKINASVQRRMPKGTDPDIAHQSVWDQLKAIMAFTEDETGFIQEAIRNFTTPTAEGAWRPKVEPPSQTQRELTMRERRPPTDVAGMPQGTGLPMPEATGAGARPIQMLPESPPLGTPAYRPDISLPEATQAALARRNITISPYAMGRRQGEPKTTLRRLARGESTGVPIGSGLPKPKEPLMPGTARFGKKIAYDLRRQHEMIGAIIRRSDRVRDMAAQMDYQTNKGNLAGDNTEKHLNMEAVSEKYPQGGDPEIKSAGIAVLSTGAWYWNEAEGGYAFNNKRYERLKEFHGSLNVGEARARKMMAQGDWRSKEVGRRWIEAIDRMRKEVDYAEKNWKDKNLRKYALEMKKELDNQMTLERDSGRSTRWKDNYFPGRYDGEFFDDSSVRFGDNRGIIIGQRYTARKVFKNYYEAIAKGPYIPASRDGSAIVGHRVRQGMRSLNRSSWWESLKQMVDPESGEPVAVNSVAYPIYDPLNPQQTIGYTFQPPTPEHVDIMIGPNQHISVRRSYERVVKDLTLQSAIPDIPALRFALEVGQKIKHGILALDIFHPMRLAYYTAAIKGGLPSYLKGSSVLEYRPSDLAKARDMGLITPEAYEWATEPIQLKAGDIVMHSTRTEIVQELLAAGLNVGRIHDAIYKELVTSLPFVGEALNKYNRLIFDKITRGFMVESAVSELIRMNHANPNARLENVARQVSKDINTFYGNLGRQGWFRSQTAQDLSRIAFLAPMWVEGLIKKEAAFVGRPLMKGVNMAMGNRTAPLNDTVMRGIGKGLLASFALTQVLNLITRQKPTWQNEEEGHKWDAWVPNMSKEKGPGFFISPLSIFADISHDIIRMFESKPNAWEGLRQIGENKLGPWGRMGLVMASQRSPTGAYLPTTGSVAASAASQLLPVPISGSKLGQQLLSYTGAVRPPPPGSVQRQAMASLGIKTEVAPTVLSQMQRLASKFVADNKLRTDMVHIEAIDNPSYAKLRAAVAAGDDAYATKMLGKLRDMGVDDKKIITEMRRWAKHPFTGSQAHEREFLRSLSDQDRDRYATAMQQKQETLEKFYDFWMKQP